MLNRVCCTVAMDTELFSARLGSPRDFTYSYTYVDGCASAASASENWAWPKKIAFCDADCFVGRG